MGASDRREYEALFRASFTSVARTVFLVVHDRAVAEELTQDAFVKLLGSWSTVSAYERPEAWVRKVAVRMALRHLSRERSRPVREMRAYAVPAPPADPDPDVAAAVRQLAPMQRAAVVLHYFEDRPVAEIADVLRVSESTVKQHLYRARARLAQALGEELVSDVG